MFSAKMPAASVDKLIALCDKLIASSDILTAFFDMLTASSSKPTALSYFRRHFVPEDLSRFSLLDSLLLHSLVGCGRLGGLEGGVELVCCVIISQMIFRFSADNSPVCSLNP